MECSAAGVLDASADAALLAALLERLARISGEAPEQMRQLEVVLAGPAYIRGQSAPELRLINHLELTPAQKQAQQAAAGSGSEKLSEQRRSERWTVRHEGLPSRGKGISELPATLRAVTDSACEGCDVLGFWRALGFVHAYSLIREGARYRCWVEGQALRVWVVRVMKGNGAGEEVAPGCWYVEAVAKPAEGQHAQGAAAIGALGKLLAPLVVLQK
jgi:hypothetical protein